MTSVGSVGSIGSIGSVSGSGCNSDTDIDVKSRRKRRNRRIESLKDVLNDDRRLNLFMSHLAKEFATGMFVFVYVHCCFFLLTYQYLYIYY